MPERTAIPTGALTDPQPPRRARRSLGRRMLSIAVRGPLGCASFLLGMLGVLLVSLPWLLSAELPSLAEGLLELGFPADFQVQGGRLRWLDRQGLSATANDGQGRTWLRAELDAPGLVRWIGVGPLLGGGPWNLGRVEATLTADLERDAEGRWVWDLPLEDPGRSEPRVEVQGGPRWRTSGLRGPISGQLLLRVPRLSVVDHRPGGPASALVLRDLLLEGELEPGSRTTLRLNGEASAPGRSPIEGIVDLGPQPLDLEARFPFDSLELEVATLPVDWVDRFLGIGGWAAAAIGDEARVTLEAATDAERQVMRGRVRVDGEFGRVDLPIEVDERGWRLQPEQTALLEVRDPGRVVRGPLVERLPAAYDLGLDAAPLVLSLDLVDWTSAAPDGVEVGGIAGWVAGLALEGSLEVGPGSLRRSDSAEALQWADARASFGVARRARPGLNARVALRGGGSLAGDLLAEPLSEHLGAQGSSDAVLWRGRVQLSEVPESVLDGWVSADGLVAAVLGGAVSGEVEIQPEAGAPGAFAISAEARAPHAELSLGGRLGDGSLSATDGSAPLSVAFDLTPLSSPRLVGPLVPLLAEVRKPTGESRARLELERFVLPLDGDLASLAGSLRLDLGRVRVELSSGLERLFPGEIESSPGALRLGLAGGVASYEDVTLDLGGERLPLIGTVDLRSGALELATEVPLAALGAESAQLDSQGAIRVPVRIGGRPPEVALEVQTADLGAEVQALLEAEAQAELERMERLLPLDPEALRGILKGWLGDG
jgi:hypothetical protein